MCTLVLLLLLASVAAAASEQSATVKTAGAAELWNGIGDVGSGDACANDAQTFCKDIAPGAGRVAACLTKRMRALEGGNSAGRKVNKKCQAQLADFKRDRSSHINKDLPLAKACAEDARKYCSQASDTVEPASVLACLRSVSSKLDAACGAEVFRTQKEAADDYSTDYRLYAACKADAAAVCADEEPDEVVHCLGLHRYNIAPACEAQVTRAEQERGSDLRLSKNLYTKCFSDYQRLCVPKRVQPGNMRAQECLEDHMNEEGFSPECKEELGNMIAKRVKNFALDTALRQACAHDLEEHCQCSLEEIDRFPEVKESAMSCLQQFTDELHSDQCKTEVHRRMSRAGENYLFDSGLATACQEDRASLCADVEAGSARVIRCLQDHHSSLNKKCAAALFDHEVHISEDIDFNYNLKRTCAYEISELCKDKPHGRGRVIRCLEQEIDNADMSKECKSEVENVLREGAQDYRLDTRLKNACEADIKTLCSNVCNAEPGVMCGGSVLHCLQEKEDKISAPSCKEEVFYYELMEVRDFRNDVILAQACRADVDSFCKDVEPGEGRVHVCLRNHKDMLSGPCRAEETKLAAIEYNDIRLASKLNKLCSEEQAVYCKGIKAGRGRMFKCLQEHMAEPEFGEDCKEQLQERDAAMQKDIRLDKAASDTCKSDIDSHCKDATMAFRGTASVLKCLVSVFSELQDSCQAEMSRVVRMSLWDYKPGSPLTEACDSAVQEFCPRKAHAKSAGAFTIGVVGRCLSKAVVEGKYLTAQCKDLVMVAAPKDVRSYYSTPEASNALMQTIMDTQAAAGMGPLLVDDQSSVTVSGWLALASIISILIVTIGLIVWGMQRLLWPDSDRPHTMYADLKDGDK